MPLIPLLVALVSGPPAYLNEIPSAAVVLSQALKTAKKEHKNVLVDFGASWCPWCRKLEVLLDHSKFTGDFENSYVIAHITVREVPDKAKLENVGWEPIMLHYRKVKDQDIPYLVILSPNGKMLGDSYEKSGQRIPNNAGYPQTSDEIAAYLSLIKRTGKGFSSPDLDALKAFFGKPGRATE